MILDRSGTRALSSVGWVDRGSVWSFDASTRATASIAISDATYLNMVNGLDGYFALVHHWDGQRLRITVHDSDDPHIALATVDVTDRSPRMLGDPAVWRKVPAVYVGYLNDDVTGVSGYFLVSVRHDGSTLSRLDWFDDDRYDHMYQGIVSVASLPDSHELLFGVQRSSDLVLWDPAVDRVTRLVPLADRGGNPTPHPHVVSQSEVWVTDYDTVVKLDPRDWTMSASQLAQAPANDGRRMFIGDLWLDRKRGSVLVPRPRGGDILVLHQSDLAVTGSVPVGGQPLSAVRTIDGTFVARDWKTGGLLLGASTNE
jgi:hypothetical protein